MVFFPGLNSQPILFALFLIVALVFSLGMLLLARRRRSAAITAIVITLVWVVLLLPDTWQLYRLLVPPPSEAIVEPFYRQMWIRGYILIFLPVPFLLFGLYLLRKRTI